MLFSCTENTSDQLICDSNNILCKFFEINHPKISFITEDNAQLSLEDINTYTQLSDQYKKDNSYKSIFDLYPKPSQDGQAPDGLLNENNLGSNS